LQVRTRPGADLFLVRRQRGDLKPSASSVPIAADTDAQVQISIPRDAFSGQHVYRSRQQRAGTSDMSAASSVRERPVATTMSGPVRGIIEGGVLAFKGVRYGTAPVGPDRFKQSKRPHSWTEIMDASSYGAAAMQMPMGLADTGADSPIKSALGPILPAPEDKSSENEDCLFLNVWTPSVEQGAKRAVMVWFHGGGFAAGSGGWPVCNGAALARQGDIVVITVNHRLNVFGYLYLGELAGMEYAQSGNAGMLDLLTALLWVRDNVRAFGGDPANVTIFGESGGGLKVSTMLAMPAAKGLFHRAIIQSGPGVRCQTRPEATQTAKAILAKLSLSLPGDMEKLLGVPAPDLVAAAFCVQQEMGGPGRGGRLAPVTDGFTVLTHPFDPAAAQSAAKIPLLIGHTKDEGTFFIASDTKFGAFTEDDLKTRAELMAPGKAGPLVAALKAARPDASPTELIAALWTSTWAFSGSVTIAERKARQNDSVYAYMLAWETPVVDGALGSTHALDLPLMFNNVEKAREFVGAGKAPQIVADQMSAAWIAFAKTGNPNTELLPDWPTYNAARRATMMFNVDSRVETDPWPKVREALVA
jgi:para-nitrobenzyl esterase